LTWSASRNSWCGLVDMPDRLMRQILEFVNDYIEEERDVVTVASISSHM